VTLRKKLFVILGGLFAGVAALTVFAALRFRALGYQIEVILRENYRSVMAAEAMKEAIERLDALLSSARAGRVEEARRAVSIWRARFERALDVERHNITLPGEGELATAIGRDFQACSEETERYLALVDPAAREIAYTATLVPLFDRIRAGCERILETNQAAMLEADRAARASADRAMWVALGAAIAAAAGGGLVTRSVVRSVLHPIGVLTASVQAIARGDLEQVVAPPAHDELGALSEAFNAMARSLREFRESSLGDLLQAWEAAQSAVDSISDPVAVFDLRRRVKVANAPARAMLGLEHAAAESEPPALPAELTRALDHVLESGTAYAPQDYERALRASREGRDLVLLPRASPMRDMAGRLVGATLVLQDVTRLKRLDELKSDVVATVAHEIRTPLTALRMNTHLLLEEMAGPLTAKQQELLVASREECDRLDQLAATILDVARIEAGALRMERRPTAPIEAAGGAADDFAAAAEARGVKLERAVPADLPLVQADPDRLRLVFANLIGNALRYTPAGGSITVAAERRGEAVRFSVIDTGCGIAPEHLPRIFEKYYRRGAVCEPANGARGAGLGLTIAREVVIAHGGEIGVESAPGKGARFWFDIPVAKEASRREAGAGR
jgi:signal transduction histidine kinase/HAMP domain-containing protein